MTDTKKTILIIEDERDLHSALEMAVKHAGFNVVSAKNGKEGISQINKSPIDLILLDVIMPFYDGVWFLQELKKLDDHKDIPVIALTNLTHGEKVGNVLQLGVSAMLTKSDSSIEKVIETINENLTE